MVKLYLLFLLVYITGSVWRGYRCCENLLDKKHLTNPNQEKLTENGGKDNNSHDPTQLPPPSFVVLIERPLVVENGNLCLRECKTVSHLERVITGFVQVIQGSSALHAVEQTVRQ